MIGIFKKCIALFAVCCIGLGMLASCGSGVDPKIESFVKDFFAAIVAEDYEKAETFLHPERPADMKAFLDSIEENEKLDFQKGIKIEKYIKYTEGYEQDVGGYRHELKIRTNVGGVTVRFIVDIVENRNGSGIYELKIDGGDATYD